MAICYISIDGGMGNVGYAAQVDDEQLLFAGVRQFGSGTNPKSEKPLQRDRGVKRRSRRGNRRKATKLSLVRCLLEENGLWPTTGQSRRIDPCVRMASCCRGGTEDKREYGFAIYRIAKKTGYDNYFDASDDDDEKKEEKKTAVRVKSSTGRLAEYRRTATSDTFPSEYLATLRPEDRKNQDFGRRERELELDAIMGNMVAKWPDLESVAEELKKLVFLRKPPSWKASTMGTCPYLGVPVADGHSRVFVECEIRSKINAIRYEMKDGDDRKLLPQTRERIAKEFLLGRRKTVSVTGNSLSGYMEDEEKEAFFAVPDWKPLTGDALSFAARKIAGNAVAEEDWAEFVEYLATGLDECLQTREGSRIWVLLPEQSERHRKELAESLSRWKGIPSTTRYELARIPFGNKTTPAYSEKVYVAALPLVREGRMLEQAVKILFDRNAGRERVKHGNAPVQGDSRWNAIVPRSASGAITKPLNDIAKTANMAISQAMRMRPDIEEFVFRLETAKELRQSADVRAKTKRMNEDNFKLREKAAGELEKKGFPLREGTITKYIQWKRQGECGSYWGSTKFDPSRLTWEHVLPESRGGTETIVIDREENHSRDNKPLDEFMGSEKVNDFLLHLGNRTKAKDGWALPKSKYDAIEKELARDRNKTPREEHLKRHGVEIGYVENMVVRLLESTGLRVEKIKGGVTAYARKKWKLTPAVFGTGTLRHKNKDDLRHHALDAVVIGFCDEAVRKAANRRYRGDIPFPYAGFVSDCTDMIRKVVPFRRRNQNKLSGQLHMDFHYARRSSYGRRPPKKEQSKPRGMVHGGGSPENFDAKSDRGELVKLQRGWVQTRNNYRCLFHLDEKGKPIIYKESLFAVVRRGEKRQMAKKPKGCVEFKIGDTWMFGREMLYVHKTDRNGVCFSVNNTGLPKRFTEKSDGRRSATQIWKDNPKRVTVQGNGQVHKGRRLSALVMV